MKDLDVAEKPVLVRTGFDVPVEDGKITNDFRIKATLDTVNYLVKNKARIIVISHKNRPIQKQESWEAKQSLRPAAEKLAEILKRKFLVIDDLSQGLPEYDVPHVYFFPQNIQKEAQINKVLEQLPPKGIAVLENLRFYPGESEKDMNFAKDLANLGKCYINDAFSNSHRDHASMTLLPKILPSAAGMNLVSEVENLSKLLHQTAKPFVVVLGGEKLETKVRILEKLSAEADHVLIGGAMANVMFAAAGYNIGQSVYREQEVRLAKRILRDYKGKLVLPEDVVVGMSPDDAPEVRDKDSVKDRDMILDIGPQSIKLFSDYIRKAKTLVWNGPLGYYEKKPYSHGTYAVARFFASRTRGRAFGVVGGGDTLQVIDREGLYSFIDHVSTGGGAMTEFLSGSQLPALKAISEDE